MAVRLTDKQISFPGIVRAEKQSIDKLARIKLPKDSYSPNLHQFGKLNISLPLLSEAEARPSHVKRPSASTTSLSAGIRSRAQMATKSMRTLSREKLDGKESFSAKAERLHLDNIEVSVEEVITAIRAIDKGSIQERGTLTIKGSRMADIALSGKDISENKPEFLQKQDVDLAFIVNEGSTSVPKDVLEALTNLFKKKLEEKYADAHKRFLDYADSMGTQYGREEYAEFDRLKTQAQEIRNMIDDGYLATQFVRKISFEDEPIMGDRSHVYSFGAADVVVSEIAKRPYRFADEVYYSFKDNKMHAAEPGYKVEDAVRLAVNKIMHTEDYNDLNPRMLMKYWSRLSSDWVIKDEFSNHLYQTLIDRYDEESSFSYWSKMLHTFTNNLAASGKYTKEERFSILMTALMDCKTHLPEGADKDKRFDEDGKRKSLKEKIIEDLETALSELRTQAFDEEESEMFGLIDPAYFSTQSSSDVLRSLIHLGMFDKSRFRIEETIYEGNSHFKVTSRKNPAMSFSFCIDNQTLKKEIYDLDWQTIKPFRLSGVEADDESRVSRFDRMTELCLELHTAYDFGSFERIDQDGFNRDKLFLYETVYSHMLSANKSKKFDAFMDNMIAKLRKSHLSLAKGLSQLRDAMSDGGTTVEKTRHQLGLIITSLRQSLNMQESTLVEKSAESVEVAEHPKWDKLFSLSQVREALKEKITGDLKGLISDKVSSFSGQIRKLAKSIIVDKLKRRFGKELKGKKFSDLVARKSQALRKMLPGQNKPLEVVSSSVRKIIQAAMLEEFDSRKSEGGLKLAYWNNVESLAMEGVLKGVLADKEIAQKLSDIVADLYDTEVQSVTREELDTIRLEGSKGVRKAEFDEPAPAVSSAADTFIDQTYDKLKSQMIDLLAESVSVDILDDPTGLKHHMLSEMVDGIDWSRKFRDSEVYQLVQSAVAKIETKSLAENIDKQLFGRVKERLAATNFEEKVGEVLGQTIPRRPNEEQVRIRDLTAGIYEKAQALTKPSIEHAEKLIKSDKRRKTVKRYLPSVRTLVFFGGASVSAFIAKKLPQFHHQTMGMRCRSTIGLFTESPSDFRRVYQEVYPHRFDDEKCESALGAFFYPPLESELDTLDQVKDQAVSGERAFNRLEESLTSQLKVRAGLAERGLPNPDAYFGAFKEVLAYELIPAVIQVGDSPAEVESGYSKALELVNVRNEIEGRKLFAVYKFDYLSMIAVVNKEAFVSHLREQGVIDKKDNMDFESALEGLLGQGYMQLEYNFYLTKWINLAAGRDKTGAVLGAVKDNLSGANKLVLAPEVFLTNMAIEEELLKGGALSDSSYIPFSDWDPTTIVDDKFPSHLASEAQQKFDRLVDILNQVFVVDQQFGINDKQDLVVRNKDFFSFDAALFGKNRHKYCKHLLSFISLQAQTKQLDVDYKELEELLRQVFITQYYIRYFLNADKPSGSSLDERPFVTTGDLQRARYQAQLMKDSTI